MTRKIAFLVEGGLEMGMGHVYRSLALAEELRDKGEVWFLTSSSHEVVKKILGNGFKALSLENDVNILARLVEMEPKIIIIDKLEVQEAFAKKLRELVDAKLVIFGNTSGANKYAHVVVNAHVGSGFKNKRIIDPDTQTLYLYGPRYVVLRKEFSSLKTGRKRRNKLQGILLIFGGADPSNLTSKVLRKLISTKTNFKLDVLVGPLFPYRTELEEVIRSQPGKDVSVYRDVKNVAAFMLDSDLVITSPGSSMYEALFVGTPVIAISQSEFQRTVFSKYFPVLEEKDLAKLEDIIYNEQFIKPTDEYVVKLDIGRGKKEIVEAILMERRSL